MAFCKKRRDTAVVMNRMSVLAAVVLACLSGCNDWMNDEGQGASVPPPSQDCICAQACGLPIVNGTFWVESQGKLTPMGACYPVHDEVLLEARAGCQCGRYRAQSRPGGNRVSPNH